MQNETLQGVNGNQIPPTGDAERFTAPRGEFTRYINSGGRDSSLGRKSVSNYIRNSLGGSSNATQRMGAARSSTARLLNIAGAFASGGARAVEQYLSIETFPIRLQVMHLLLLLILFVRMEDHKMKALRGQHIFLQ